MSRCQLDTGPGQQVDKGIGARAAPRVDRIQHLFILVRAGDRQHLGMHAGDVLRLGPQTAGHDHPAVFGQRLADRLEAFGLGTVEKPAGVHDHRLGPGIIGRDAIAFGAQPGQDALAVDQRLGTAQRDHADGRLAFAGRFGDARARQIGAQVGGIGAKRRGSVR